MTDTREDLDLVTVAEAARITGVERNTMYRYMKEGKVPYQMRYGRRLIKRSDAEAVHPKSPGYQTRKQPLWTRALTVRRLEEWNTAVVDGTFDDPKTGKVDPGLIAAWEIDRGWSHEDLMEAANRILKGEL